MLSTSEDAGFYSHNRDREFRPLAEPNPTLPFSQPIPILPPRRPRRKEAVPPQDFLTDWTIINGAYGLQLGHKGEGTWPYTPSGRRHITIYSKVSAKQAVRCIIFNPANALPFCALFKRTFRWKLLKHSCLNPNGRNFHPRFGRRKTGAKEFNLPIADKGCAQATGKPTNVHHLSIANKAARVPTLSCFTSIHAGQMQLQPLLLCPPPPLVFAT